MKNIIAIATVVLMFVSSCTQNVDTTAEKAQVKEQIDKMIQAMTSEDMASFSTLVAHDSDMVSFGTDSSERWVGWDALKAAVQQQFDAFSNIKMAMRDLVIHVGTGGNVAWFSGIMDWNLQVGDNPMSLKGLRFTGVMEKRAGKWLFVQMHYSVGVSGQAAEY